jgi:hypothetical protein
VLASVFVGNHFRQRCHDSGLVLLAMFFHGPVYCELDLQEIVHGTGEMGGSKLHLEELGASEMQSVRLAGSALEIVDGGP